MKRTDAKTGTSCDNYGKSCPCLSVYSGVFGIRGDGASKPYVGTSLSSIWPKGKLSRTRRCIVHILAFLFISIEVVVCQSTIITGVVSDPSGNVYPNAPITVDFYNPDTKIANWNNFPLTVTTWSTNADSFGSFSIQVPDLNFIAPASGTFYRIKACANTVASMGGGGGYGGGSIGAGGPALPSPSGQPTNPCGLYTTPSCPTAGCITGATISVTAALDAIMPPNPIVSQPASLGGNNAFTGNNTFTGTSGLNGGGNIAGTWTGAPTLTGVWTHSAADNLNSGGNFTGTFTGNPDFTGAPTYSILLKRIVAGSTLYPTIALALAACPSPPVGCWVYALPGTFNPPAFTLGVSPSQSGYAQILELSPATTLLMTGKISELSGAYIKGNSRDGSIIKSDPTFPTGTPLVDMGDNVNLIDARIEGVTVNCNSIATCTAIRARGLNEYSVIRDIYAPNYLANCINIDGTITNTGNWKVEEIQCAAATGASDGIFAKNSFTTKFERITVASNSGVAIAAACVQFASPTSNNPPTHVILLHCEKHNDALFLNGTDNVYASVVDASNVVTNTLHISAAATGSITAFQLHNNANAACPATSCVVKNDATGTQLAATNPPAPNGIIPEYVWNSGILERWTDFNGYHFGLGKVIIGGGSPITKYYTVSGAYTPASTAANTCAEQTFSPAAFNGVINAGDNIYINPLATMAGNGVFPVMGVRAVANGVAITFCNVTAGALTAPAGTIAVTGTR